LGANTTLKASTMELPGVTGDGFNLTLDNSSTVTLNGAISGVNVLVIDGDKQPGGNLIVNNSININEGEIVENSIQLNQPVTVDGTLELVAEGGGISQTGTATITAKEVQIGNTGPGGATLLSGLNNVANNNVFFLNGRTDNAQFFDNPALDFPNTGTVIGSDLFFSQQLVSQSLVGASSVFADVDRYVTVYLPPVLLGTGAHVEAPEPVVAQGGNSQDGYLVRSVREVQ